MEEKDLKKYSLKQTKNREEILNILKKADGPLCAEEINEKMKLKVNLSTIYRTLTTLTTKGILMKNVKEDKVAYYEIAEKHKHSLFCKNCKEIILIESCPLEEVLKDIKEKTGYEITGHSLEISGICSKCKNKINKNNK